MVSSILGYHIARPNMLHVIHFLGFSHIILSSTERVWSGLVADDIKN